MLESKPKGVDDMSGGDLTDRELELKLAPTSTITTADALWAWEDEQRYKKSLIVPGGGSSVSGRRRRRDSRNQRYNPRLINY